jgi:hypothetical protein
MKKVSKKAVHFVEFVSPIKNQPISGRRGLHDGYKPNLPEEPMPSLEAPTIHNTI